MCGASMAEYIWQEWLLKPFKDNLSFICVGGSKDATVKCFDLYCNEYDVTMFFFISVGN